MKSRTSQSALPTQERRPACLSISQVQPPPELPATCNLCLLRSKVALFSARLQDCLTLVNSVLGSGVS